MRLTILRHGETDWNASQRIQGQQDVPLNERGLAQAQAAAAYLQTQDFDALYSSDLRRAVDSALPVSRALNVSIQTDKNLREWKLGILEGLLRTEAAEQHPQVYQIYNQQQPDGLIPQGETIRERYQRSTQAIEALCAKHPEQQVLLVTHGGILDNWYRYVNQIPLEAPRDWVLNNAGISQFEKHQGQWSMLTWSETGHLADIGSLAFW